MCSESKYLLGNYYFLFTYEHTSGVLSNSEDLHYLACYMLSKNTVF